MIKNIHKYSINKKTKYVISLISLSTVLVMTACEKKCDDVVQSEPVVYTEEVKTPLNIVDGDKPLASIASTRKEYAKVSISPEEYQNYLLELSEINPTFEYEEMYNLDAALKEYEKYDYTKHHDDVFHGTITTEQLVKIVRNNNKEYISASGTTNYKELNDADLNMVCSLIVGTINDQITNVDNVNDEDIKCILSNLTVFESSSVIGRASVGDNDMLLIAPEMLDENQKREYLEDTIVHETIHIVQRGCKCEYENNNIKSVVGFSKEYPNLEINSLQYSWLFEASAEKCKANYLQNNPILYENYINAMESLGLICTINSNYNVHDIEHLIYYDKLEDLYEFFGAESDQDKLELLKMMYTIEVVETTPLDFYHKYEEKIGYSITSQEKTALTEKLEISACQVMNKIFYRNLAKRLSEEEISLNDVFYLMTIYENDLNSHVHYDVTRRYENNKEMIDNYLLMQDGLFEIIANKLGLSIDDIINEYESYRAYTYDDNKEQINNYDLSWLGKDKIDYLDSRKEALEPYIGLSLRVADCEIKEELDIKSY